MSESLVTLYTTYSEAYFCGVVWRCKVNRNNAIVWDGKGPIWKVLIVPLCVVPGIGGRVHFRELISDVCL